MEVDWQSTPQRAIRGAYPRNPSLSYSTGSFLDTRRRSPLLQDRVTVPTDAMSHTGTCITFPHPSHIFSHRTPIRGQLYIA